MVRVSYRVRFKGFGFGIDNLKNILKKYLTMDDMDVHHG